MKRKYPEQGRNHMGTKTLINQNDRKLYLANPKNWKLLFAAEPLRLLQLKGTDFVKVQLKTCDHPLSADIYQTLAIRKLAGLDENNEYVISGLPQDEMSVIEYLREIEF